VASSTLGAARAARRARSTLRRDRRRPSSSAPRIALGIVAVSAALVLAGVVASRNDVSVRGESEFAPGDPSEISSLTARSFEFDAKRLGDGSVRGSYRYRGFRNNLAFEASGRVTCLAVRGRHAWIGGRIEQTNDPLVRGDDMWFQVVDHGRDADQASLIGMSSHRGAAKHYCKSAPPPRFEEPVARGHIDVRG
jgi:hypothetical protein